MRHVIGFIVGVVVMLNGGGVWAADPGALPGAALPGQEVAFFEQHVRPLLVARCYECHSSEAKILKGGLHLDRRAGWQRGGDSGHAVIVPGKPEESLLIRAVSYEHEELQMPPKGRLSEDELEVLREWVRRGAVDPREPPEGEVPGAGSKGIDIEAGKQWWAFVPLKPVAPPAVKDQGWVRTAVDNFVLAKLEERGIEPNERADRRTLVRRLYYDLVGLPPPPEVVERFVSDQSPDAYARLVDELLTSPHHGERWGRHWLDVARFAESYGFEHDYDRPHAYHYRDFVIKAINADMPYDQFVKWQLAGDEYEPAPEGDPLAMMATGFLGAGVFPTQITQKEVEKSRYDDMDDMLSTTGVAFLGMTIGCARCHDHKFDPIPAADYYNMLATFTTTVRSEVEINLDPAGYEQAKRQYEAEHGPLVAAREAYEREQLPSRLNAWLAEREAGRPRKGGDERAIPAWLVLDATKSVSRGKATFENLPDGSLLVSGANPDHDTFTITAQTPLGKIGAVRLEALAHESLVRGGPGRASNGNFGLSDFAVTVAPLNPPDGDNGKAVEVKLVRPRSTFDQAGLGVANAIDNDKTSCWAVDPKFGEDHAAVFEFAEPVGFEGGTVLTFTLTFTNNTQHGIGRPRISVAPAPGSEAGGELALDGEAITQKAAEALALLDAGKELDDQGRSDLLAWFRTTDPGWRELNDAVEQHALKALAKPNVVTVQVCSEGVKPMRKHSQGADFFETTYHLRRGDPNMKQGEAKQSFMQVLMRHPDGAAHWPAESAGKTSGRRRAMAEWITDVEYGAGHLLARVAVNRLWQHHMGRGIVATSGDFGVQGSPPTHPELLDYLANELIASGWRLSHVHRLILNSATYQQSAEVHPPKVAKDGDNELWWRWPRRRLEGEVIRDSMLAASGQLDATQFGPGTLDPGMKRRSIYFFIKRSRLIPMMLLFDAPDALQPISTRATTTVAPQALLMINSDIVRDYADALAKRVRPVESMNLKQAIDAAYRLTLSRPPAELETVQALAFIDEQAASYEPAGRVDPAGVALADFCQALMASNEFVYVE